VKIANFMNIWVDADACPIVIRSILFKAAMRTGTLLTLVANQAIQVPRSPLIRMRQVSQGFDVADDEIVKLCCADDLVITSDIPLAAQIVEKGAHALSPRGEVFSTANIGERLNMRDFMETLRGSGIQTGGPAAMSQSERAEFANQLDKLLTRYAKHEKG